MDWGAHEFGERQAHESESAKLGEYSAPQHTSSGSTWYCDASSSLKALGAHKFQGSESIQVWGVPCTCVRVSRFRKHTSSGSARHKRPSLKA
eukprot:2484255-Rhodomonas_salina.1